MNNERADLFFLVDAGDDDIHLLFYHAVWNDAAAERSGVVDLYKQECKNAHTALSLKPRISAHNLWF